MLHPWSGIHNTGERLPEMHIDATVLLETERFDSPLMPDGNHVSQGSTTIADLTATANALGSLVLNRYEGGQAAKFLEKADPTGLQVLKKCRVSGRRHFCHPTSFQGRGCKNGRSTEDPASGSGTKHSLHASAARGQTNRHSDDPAAVRRHLAWCRSRPELHRAMRPVGSGVVSGGLRPRLLPARLWA